MSPVVALPARSSGAEFRMTDAELLCRAQSGDADAWRTLYRRHMPAAWRQATALIRDIHAAEDVAAEAMLALLRNLQKVDGGVECLSAWLRQVVRCKAADHFRKQKAAAEPGEFETLTNGQSVAALGDGNSIQSLEAGERREQVLRTLDRLSERERLMLQWKYFDGLAVKEMAERLGESDRAIEAVLYRARKEFRRLFESSSGMPAEAMPRIWRETDINHAPSL